MKTAVNPASIAPGLLRDLISPNWLGKESDRLFNETPDEGTPETSGSQSTQ